MRLRIFALALCCFFLAAGCAKDKKSYEIPSPQKQQAPKKKKSRGAPLAIRFNMPPGATCEVEYISNIDTLSHFHGQDLAAKGETNIRLRMRSEQMGQKGVTMLDVEVIQCAISDRITVDGKPDVQDTEVQKYIAALAKALPGKHFKVAIDRDGDLIGIEGAEALDAAVAKEADPRVLAMFSSVPGETLAWKLRFANPLAADNLAGMMQEIFHTLPNRSVHDGDRWLIGANNVWWQQMWLQGTYVLQSHGRNDARAKLEAVIGSPRRFTGPLRLSGKVTGDATYDVNAGIATAQHRLMQANCAKDTAIPRDRLVLERVTNDLKIKVTMGQPAPDAKS